MSRLLLGLMLAVVLRQSAKGQDAGAPVGSRPPILEDLHKNPEDVAALGAYLNATIRRFVKRINTEDAERHADVLLEEANVFDAVVKSVKPQDVAAKKIVLNMQRHVLSWRNHARALMSPYAHIARQLTDVERNIVVNGNSKEMVGKIHSLKEDLQKEIANAVGKEHSEVLDYLANYATELQRPLIAAYKLTEMIGKPAAPLNVETWVNGSALQDGELVGKVVLLDFWAVYCGPCIATFPQLSKWHEKYAEKGLVIIGVTGFYDYQWDDQTGTAVKSESKVSQADERAAVAKFVKSHELLYRTAITGDDTLWDYYGVISIPHVVVIDREGIIRLMKVGGDAANTKEIDDLLVKLLEHKASGGD